MKKSFLLAIFAIATSSLFAQDRYFTKTGHIVFTSDAPTEKIEGHNYKSTAVLDATTGKMEFAILMKSFEFTQSLMQEHFNENYVESNKYPQAVFKGSVQDISSVNLAADGQYPVKVKGTMTMHGVSQPVEADGKFTVKGGVISANSTFVIKLADYKIAIPSLVASKISETVKIVVKLDKLEKMK